jgi:hypothetical protein
MNIFAVLNFAILFMQLNKGQSEEGKKIIGEAFDVVQSLGDAMKDNKVTNAEKTAVIKELREFSKTATNFLDSIVLPE